MRSLDPCPAVDCAGHVEIDNGGMAVGSEEEPLAIKPDSVLNVRGEGYLIRFLITGA